MKLADLNDSTLAQLRELLWDRIIEKHEGPWHWQTDLKGDFADFLSVQGYEVLLPVDQQYHGNITIDRCIVSEDRNSLTIFLQDVTYEQGIFAGYLAVCERFPGEDWYVAIVYHECWVSELTTCVNR